MAQEFYEALRAVWHSGKVEMCIRRYSGRHMYGAQCLAIEIPSAPDLFRIGAMVGAMEPRAWEADELPEPKLDNMGRGMVAYWPEIEWQPEWQEGEEDAPDEEEQ